MEVENAIPVVLELVEDGDIDGDELLLLSHWSSGETSPSFFSSILFCTFNFNVDFTSDECLFEVDELTMVDVVLVKGLLIACSCAGMFDAAAVRFESVFMWMY